MLSFNFEDLGEAYAEMLWKIKVFGVKEQTRNGEVIAFPEPVGFSFRHPERRVLLDATRDANPFFHLMEAVWMLAGQNDIAWLAQFNKRISTYAEDDGHMRGAYGHRWRYHFGYDQLVWAVEELKRDSTSRRVVLSMWDQPYDTVGAPNKAKDLPCNTHIMLRITNSRLNLTVCNRSNDLIWGALGANAVHMTVLQEVLARALEVQLGSYTVMTNNLHMYTGMPRFQEIIESVPDKRSYPGLDIVFDDFKEFLFECHSVVMGIQLPSRDPGKWNWLTDVVVPTLRAWESHNVGDCDNIYSKDWSSACQEWLMRRSGTSSFATSTELSQTTTTGSISSGEKMQSTKSGMSTSDSVETTPPSAPSSN